MIKSLKRVKLTDKKDLRNSLVVAYRDLHDVFVKMETNGIAEFNETTQELVLRFPMKQGDVLVIGDKDGIAPAIKSKKVR